MAIRGVPGDVDSLDANTQHRQICVRKDVSHSTLDSNLLLRSHTGTTRQFLSPSPPLSPWAVHQVCLRSPRLRGCMSGMWPHHGDRKVIRKTLLILSILGLVLSVGLWAASHLDITIQPAVGGASLQFTGGAIQYFSGSGIMCAESLETPEDWAMKPITKATGLSGFTTHWRPGVRKGFGLLQPTTIITVPLWCPFVLSHAACLTLEASTRTHATPPPWLVPCLRLRSPRLDGPVSRMWS